ncbi:hypothetical protein [Paraburkholderia sp. A1RO-5L]|uniref:hypothetical protein n=1 Tax=Paraburkholderia sp. A1RO-5L TaxID=3028370 RepID=UPI003B7CDE58
MTTKPKHPDEDGPRKMGRPSDSLDDGVMTPRQIRLDDYRWAKCRRIAKALDQTAAAWIRDRIDETPDPGETPEPPKRRK